MLVIRVALRRGFDGKKVKVLYYMKQVIVRRYVGYPQVTHERSNNVRKRFESLVKVF